MRPAVRDELLRINRAFYQSLAEPFASKRRRPQPGVLRVVARVDGAASVLDVGCGHGLAAQALARAGHEGRYVGIDASQPLVALARRRVDTPWADFSVADLAQPGWRHVVEDASVDWALAFAVLHHIPDAALRLEITAALRSALRPGGRAAVSVWDFAGHDRFRRRVLAWEEFGLTSAEVEPGDYLLDWRHGDRGVRYVHHFSPAELQTLARTVGFVVEEEFHADGQGGQLGLYQIWRT